MLNTFPDLLVFGFFAPTILRIAVAASFAYLAYSAWAGRERIAHIALPLVGKQPWVPTFSAVVYGVLALMLFAGYYTQVAALIGALATVKGLVLDHRYPEAFPFSRSTYTLLAVICLSLLFTGAGAFAYDLPL